MFSQRTQDIVIFFTQMMVLLIVGGTFGLLNSKLSSSESDQTQDLSPKQSFLEFQREDGLRILGDQIDHLRELGIRLADHIRGLRPTAIGESLVDQARHARFWVAVSLTGAGKEIKSRLIKALTDKGYTVTPEEFLHLRPSNPENRSTVFYFHDEAFGVADELAKFVGNLSMGVFDIRRGFGLPISHDQERWTFFVHYIHQEK